MQAIDMKYTREFLAGDTVGLISVGINKLFLNFFPNILTSKVKILLTSLVIGILSFLPANILALYIINLLT